jgi:hypothetical protein
MVNHVCNEYETLPCCGVNEVIGPLLLPESHCCKMVHVAQRLKHHKAGPIESVSPFGSWLNETTPTYWFIA